MSHATATWSLATTATSSSTSSSITPGVDLELADDGDLLIDSDLHFTTGLKAVAQGVQIRLLRFRGEWFLNLDAGVPYFQDLLGKKFNELRARNAFRPEILAAPGVKSMVSLSVPFDTKTREMKVNWRVDTDLGELSGVTEV